MVCVCVCVCVCVRALVWTDIWGNFCVFNRISADTRGVGTSPVVRPMPINVLSIFKHIYIVNVIFFICPHTVVKMKVCVYRGVGSVGSWRIKNTFCVYCVRNGPRLVDYNHKLVCIPPTHTSPFSGLKIRKN